MLFIKPKRKSVEPSHLSFPDLIFEAVAAILQRPGRAIMTMVGTFLGIGTFVILIGISQTASSQISSQFNVLDATQVNVTDVSLPHSQSTYNFSPDSDSKIDRLSGVIASGIWWQVQETAPTTAFPGVGYSQIYNLYAIDSSVLKASGGVISQGTGFSSFDVKTHQNVIILSSPVASELGINNLENAPAVFIGDKAFTVVGILSNDERLPQLEIAMMIPTTTALDLFGLPTGQFPAQMLIHTKLGASDLITRQAPVALNPTYPVYFRAISALNPSALKNQVVGNLNTLFYILAAIAVIIGAVGIANTTLVAILERTGEIGLRRALGARRSHIAAHFLIESVFMGLIAGLVGSSCGVLVIILVALAKHWTAVLDPYIVIIAPFTGALIGLLAGLYPSIRASGIEPAEALRR